MEFLRKILDTVGKNFEHGGKLEKFHALFELHDTILFTPASVTKSPSHVRDSLDLKRMMITVVIALLPIVLFAMYNVGYQAAYAIGHGANAFPGWQTEVYQALGLGYDTGNPFLCVLLGSLYFLPIFIAVGATGGLVEVGFATLRGHEVTEGFLVSWFLLALSLPPTIPVWQVVIGCAFGLIFGKEVYGGVGKNFLNPALTARAFLFFAYPGQISGDAVWTAASAVSGADAWSGATALSVGAANGLAAIESNLSWMQSFIGLEPGSMGETSALLCLVGAVILIATGIGSWRVMAGVVAGTAALSFLLNAIGSDTNHLFELPFHWHVVLGGWAFGTVFMATDPVSSAFTDLGKFIYGVGVGLMVVLVRVINPAYPEGMMLAILFMNMVAPLIDHVVIQQQNKRRKVRYGRA
jgi:Na+-transporting NADH:ubiquinone oxidoreductase subunit B